MGSEQTLDTNRPDWVFSHSLGHLLDRGLLRLSAKSYAKGLKHVFHSLSDFHLDRRICIE